MSVITEVEATPQRLELVWQFLNAHSGRLVPRAELLEALSPAPLRRGSTPSMASAVVKAAVDLDLAAGDGDAYHATTTVPSKDRRAVRPYLERILTDLSSAESHKQAAFPLALAWFLEQDPAQPLPWDEDRTAARIKEQCHDESGFDMTTKTTWQQFLHWARYLGFATRLDVQGQRGHKGQGAWALPDPTVALSRHLPPLLRSDDGRPQLLRDVLHDLGQRCPVFEGGAARAEIARKMNNRPRVVLGRLSASTSFALLRLHRRGIINLQTLSDTDAVVLEGCQELPLQRVNYIAAGANVGGAA